MNVAVEIGFHRLHFPCVCVFLRNPIDIDKLAVLCADVNFRVHFIQRLWLISGFGELKIANTLIVECRKDISEKLE